MERFKELSNEELRNINGGAWPLIAKAVVWVVGACAAGVAGYYAVEAVQGIEDGLDGECCDCEC
ncbi:class IIb bacteriocin, lactobin A/cerein 7B family [Algoriphagus sp. AGSA1]|nr:class IIb bacteriocin, lactobin A/cerein 7B family [Algoriphagus sp. AGSA1]MCE7054421.1 class IIb bacteriocin, lactobin A/cerein 7B family [Algoriphagus sp. AGSA1]